MTIVMCRCCCCQVITREVDGHKCEPFEEAIVEVPEQYVGSVVELFAQRKGEMQDMQPSIEVRSKACFVKCVSSAFAESCTASAVS